MNPTEKRVGPQHLLYDADLLHDVDPALFEPELLEQAGLLRGSAAGRGAAHFIELDGRQYVLRHYRRGGLVAGLLDDRYLRTTLSRTRPWREWYLLARLTEYGLPAPTPAAARMAASGPFYRADLITLRITNSQPLAEVLQNIPLEKDRWHAIGKCIGRFHSHGVFHADLNAHNILLGSTGEIHLIDFDRGEIRDPAPKWQRSNLARLRRSLDKLSGQHPIFHFTGNDWQALLDGWRDQ